jgi:hypothetical protein
MQKTILILTTILLLSLVTYTNSQWGTSCVIAQPPVGGAKVQTWQYFSEDNQNAILLYENNVCVGLWHYKDNYWCDYNAQTGKWGEKQLQPRVEPPVNEQFPRFYFGVIRESGYGCTRKGEKITVQDAINIMDSVSDRIQDSSKLLRLTIIGSKEDRDRIADSYAKLEPETLKRIAIFKVGPDHWSLRDNDTNKPIFDTTAKLNIYLTDPNGKVLHRQEDFDGEPSFIALRKGIKNYDKTKDPDLRKPDQPVVPTPGPVPGPGPNPLPKPNPLPEPTPDIWEIAKLVPWYVWIIVVAGGGVLFINNKELLVDLLRKIPTEPKK